MALARLFTVARANRAIPFVARIIDDIVARTVELKALSAERAAAPREARDELERRLGDVARELERHADELASVGCELKDPETGLIDFPARNGESAILLCWRKGEERVEWWHAVDTGFKGRRPVSELPASTLGE